MFKKISLSGLLFLLPVVAFAQPTSAFGQIGDTIRALIGFMNGTLVPLVFAMAFLVFIWGMFKFFIFGGHDEESRESGKQLMIYGVVAFVMMVSIWGIVNVVAEGLGFRKSTIDQIPTLPTTR